MIIDAFTYNGEAAMLEFRLQLLWSVVDKFIIVEANKTFSGNDKAFSFEAQQEQFAWAKEKIVYYKLEVDTSHLNLSDKPTAYDPNADCWKIEYQQRNAIIEACGFAADDDLLIMGDVDELPTREAVRYAVVNKGKLPLVCRQFFFYYNLTNLRNEIWQGTIFSTMKQAREISTQGLRNRRIVLPYIEPGGFHLSYFGGAEKILEKIESFSHQELNIPEFKDAAHLGACLDTGRDLFNRPVSGLKVDGSFFPAYFAQEAKQCKML